VVPLWNNAVCYDVNRLAQKQNIIYVTSEQKRNHFTYVGAETASPPEVKRWIRPAGAML
jgi:hypothetical protein